MAKRETRTSLFEVPDSRAEKVARKVELLCKLLEPIADKVAKLDDALFVDVFAAGNLAVEIRACTNTFADYGRELDRMIERNAAGRAA